MSVSSNAPAPEPRNVADALRFATQQGMGREYNRLQGAVVGPDWLPADSGLEGMDALRDGHLRHLAQVGAALDSAWEPLLKFRQEDREHETALKLSMATGSKAPKDSRTPEVERQAALKALEMPRRAAIAAFADWVDETVAEIKERAVEWHGALNAKVAEAREARREAERLLAAATAAETAVGERLVWLRSAAMDQYQQPAQNAGGQSWDELMQRSGSMRGEFQQIRDQVMGQAIA